MTQAKHKNQAKTFSEIHVGNTVEFQEEITEERHQAFSNLFGDYSPIHTDDAFSAKTKFKRKIGYAYMLTGFLSKLYGEYLPGGSSVCIKQDAKFIKPYFIGDTITIHAKVLHAIDSTQCVEIQTEMFRNEKECIFKGVGLVQIFLD